MAAPFNTLLLDVDAWDLTVDAAGNIAMASAPYSLAQDVASAIKLFKGELWYDTLQGIPYFQQILGRYPSVALVKAQLVQAALTVPGVVAAVAFISEITDRTLSGQVQVTDRNGVIQAVAF
jgi:hypothetical protein